MGRRIDRREALIELRRVSKTFDDSNGRIDALVDITLRIDAGEFVCITGPSGSGKSTLLNVVGCLDRLTSGSYRFADADLSGSTSDNLARLRRRAFGFVFQDYKLLDSVSAQANVEMPLTYTVNDRGSRRDRAQELLTTIGMGNRVAHRPSELSGGEQQRVSIARALANGAQVVIADEPTGALNSEQGGEVIALLKQLAECGHTIVVASHDPALVAQATRCIEIRDGRLVHDTKALEHTMSPTPLNRIRQEATVSPPQLNLTRTRFAWCATTNAMAALRYKRWRTTIMLGCVVMGVWSLIASLSLTRGAYRESMEIVGRMGADKFLVYQVISSIEELANATFSFDDIAEIEADVENVSRIRPRRGGEKTIRYQDEAYTAVVYATTEDAPEAKQADFREWHVAEGRFLDEVDGAENEQVAVLGRPVRDGLFGPGASAVGERITIDGMPFQVKGVLGPYPELAGTGMLGGIAKDQRLITLESVAYIPFGIAAATVFGDDEPVSLVVEVKDVGQIEETAEDVRNILIRRRGRENFAMQLPVEYAFSYRHLARTHRDVVIAVAIIGVVLAGLVVSSVMLVSVAERTREIGIRMAVGARRVDVLGQFLVEALVPSVGGGVLGLALAYLTGSVLEGVIGAAVAFEPWFGPVALVCSTLTGLVFGVVPARRAAQLDPIIALGTA